MTATPKTLRQWISEERGRARMLAEGLALKNPSNPVLVYQWTSEEDPRPVPIERCADIERLTGGEVSRIVLRPDDWHRIWPELAAANPELVPPSAAAPAQQEAA